MARKINFYCGDYDQATAHVKEHNDGHEGQSFNELELTQKELNDDVVDRLTNLEDGKTLNIFSNSDIVFNAIRLLLKDKVLTPDEVVIYFFSGCLQNLSLNSDGYLNSQWPDGFFDMAEQQLLRLL